MQLLKARERQRREGCKDGRVEGWKDGRVEGWKDGRVEGWKGGRMEGLDQSFDGLFLTWRAAN